MSSFLPSLCLLSFLIPPTLAAFLSVHVPLVPASLPGFLSFPLPSVVRILLQVLSSQEKRPTEAEILAAVEEGDKAAGVFGKIF